jgi:hypothetical protein
MERRATMALSAWIYEDSPIITTRDGQASGTSWNTRLDVDTRLQGHVC